MGISSTKATFEAYKRAAESNDDRALAELYADDAEMIDVNRRTPPASPERVHGRDAIRTRMDAVSKELVHQIADPVLDDDKMAFSESCEYPNGQKVFAIHLCQLRQGKIAREVITEAWDE